MGKNVDRRVMVGGEAVGLTVGGCAAVRATSNHPSSSSAGFPIASSAYWTIASRGPQLVVAFNPLLDGSSSRLAKVCRRLISAADVNPKAIEFVNALRQQSSHCAIAIVNTLSYSRSRELR